MTTTRSLLTTHQSSAVYSWHTIALLSAVAALAWAISALPVQTLAGLAGAIALAVAALRWPWIVWPALALALPLSSGTRFGPLTGTELLLLLIVGLWLMDGARRRRLVVYASPVLMPVLIYAGVLLVSLLRAPSLGDGFPEVVKWAEFALVIGLLPAMVTRKGARWMAVALVGAGVAQALWGLFQFVFQIGPEWFILFDRYMRASGSFHQPNPYAAYLGVLLPIAVSLSIWSWSALWVDRPNRIASVLCAAFYTASSVVIVAGMLASWSRGGWLAAAGALLAVLAVRSRFGIAVAGAVAAVLVVAVPLAAPFVPAKLAVRVQGAMEILRPGELMSQPVTDDNFALLERLAHWVAGFRMWDSAPWLGIGAGNYAVVYENVRVPVWPEPLGHAHNLYINILAETGIIGLAAFAIMWASLAVWSWRRGRSQSSTHSRGWCRAMSAAALGAMTYVTLHSVVDVLFVHAIYLTLGLVFATLAAGCREDVPASSAQSVL